MHVHLKRSVLLLLAAVLAACSVFPGAQAGLVVRSNQARISAPEVTSSVGQALAEGNNTFAMELYQALMSERDGNLFFSPFSISLALAMTYAGARGSTQAQMADVLHFTLPDGQLHPAFNALDQQLAQRAETGGKGADGKGFRLNIVNDLWGQVDYAFLPDFLDLLAKNYGAGLRTIDFQANPEAARAAINDHIVKQTEKRIKDLIPPGAIDTLTRLVLTNAIYFNAAWQVEFNQKGTQDAPFYRLDGSTQTVKMMRMDSPERFQYLRGADFQAISLPYEGQQLSMLVLVPASGAYPGFEASLSAAQLADIRAQLRGQPVALRMPRFTFESDFSLVDPLAVLGMSDAFDPNLADFSGMTGERDLYISDVIHKSFVEVNEAGTEAAAATAVIMRTTSALIDEPVQLTIDRPFLFMIIDEPTNTILFAGRLLTP